LHEYKFAKDDDLMKVFSFRNLRITILLILLALAAIYTQDQSLNTRSWYKPITVTVFPINGDGQQKTDDYIANLSSQDFHDIDVFFTQNAKKFDLITQQPVITMLGDTVTNFPPEPPQNRKSILSAIFWSLGLRYWAFNNTPDTLSNSNRIRLYVIYHQENGSVLAHSLGLQKGLIGVIHAYADKRQNQQNAIVLAHEIFHTVGARDKYDHQNLPLFPVGYAEPDRQPLHPQRYAEIMAGRVALSARKATMPASLKHVTVGKETAKEINWIPAE
jgi:hypothetical protein